ncbi:glycoprotein-N-acetylgalactosamine 3-beta-galactosyltransferase 1-like [Acanthaster planci]|uniref:Glycoprotein-N-acetylgalactosamine 3-beta-galactosyltransferase 1-like n=1 Tax=Acanthaster planci TaxID=133434 RepID=A0A8B7XID0_ACAPL|nr:glycoprotein-N-acetylgalactosamine 3-beta-galactosyltransferase 1-like [Acanthaster planci]
MNLTSFISMILGLTAGVLTAIIFSKFQAISRDKETVVPKRPARPTLTGSQCVYFRFPKEANEISKQKTPAGLSAEAVNFDSRRDLFDPRLNSTFLYNKVKILCFVLLQKGHIGNYGKSAKATWTKHCNKVVFLSSVQNGDIGTIDIKLPGGKSDWPRSKLGLRYVYDHFLDSEFDWFLKTGHDSFPVLENLRYLLLMHQANIPNYIGHVFSGPKSGGSVFALSKQALALIGPTLQDYVPAFGGVADDLEMEACLKAAGATSDYQGMDLDGVQRFRMIVPDHKLPMNTKGYTAWYWQYIRHPEKEVAFVASGSCVVRHGEQVFRPGYRL